MSILSILGLKKCMHERMSLNVECGYCPDCGEYVENRWYLVRCACCGVKRPATARGNEIMPASFYCSNCGEDGYFIAALKKPNFIDINYAAVLKVSPKDIKENYSQSWVQNETNNIRLIGLCS